MRAIALVLAAGLMLAGCGRDDSTTDRPDAGTSDKPGDEGTANRPADSETIYQFTMDDIDGNPTPLSTFRGKTLLVLNVASKCGNTPQYAKLETIYEKYKGDGLVVLGFPANNFGNQEPGLNAEIKTFCEGTYGVSFPMFAKISVKGDDIAPLYAWLTNPAIQGEEAGIPIRWNFDKFLIGPDGKVVARFDPKTQPDSEEVVSAIKQNLPKE